MFTLAQMILIIVWFTFYNAIGQIGFSLVAGGVVLNGVVVGAIMGDPSVGFFLGGTYELMNIGLNPLGGSSVPNYNLGVVVGTAFGITSGLETGMAVGILVATLGTSLDVFGKMVGSFFLHRAQNDIKNFKFKRAMNWLYIGFWPKVLLTATIPLVVVFFAGPTLVQSILDFIPKWFLTGFKTAGNLLPALGYAILLHSISIKGNVQYLILGFFLFAYLKVGALGAALVGITFALLAYYNDKRFNEQSSNGGVGDE